jgi:hypothetical protein
MAERRIDPRTVMGTTEADVNTYRRRIGRPTVAQERQHKKAVTAAAEQNTAARRRFFQRGK